ncbi:hypothetical protein ACHAW6_000385 [Cyclotella cf. meneghiniana]
MSSCSVTFTLHSRKMASFLTHLSVNGISKKLTGLVIGSLQEV